MGKYAPVVIALIAGISLAVQGPINSELARHLGRLHAVLVSVLVSSATVALILLLQPGDGSFVGLTQTPRWALIGGLLGVVVLFGTIIAVPRIGAAATAAAIIGGQTLAAALIDRFGLLGVTARALTPGRLLGLVLIVVAVALVSRG